MPRYRYELAHHTFRKYCNSNPEEFFAQMTAMDNKIFIKKVLKSIGKIVDAEDSPVTAGEIKVFEHEHDAFKILFIEMLEPIMITDAYYIGIVFSQKKQNANDTFRYFTLEMGVDGNETSMCCEWKGNAHVNYGLLPDKSLDSFLTAIILEIGADGWDDVKAIADYVPWIKNEPKLTDEEHQKKNLEAIYNAGALAPVFKANPKYCVNEFAELIPYITYNDVMDNKFIIRGRPLEAGPTFFDSKERPIIVEYSAIDDLINDGWRLD